MLFFASATAETYVMHATWFEGTFATAELPPPPLSSGAQILTAERLYTLMCTTSPLLRLYWPGRCSAL